jgi:hypothetical protein
MPVVQLLLRIKVYLLTDILEYLSELIFKNNSLLQNLKQLIQKHQK